MLLQTELMAARMVAEKMTLGGNWLHFKIMPPACHRYTALKSWALREKQKVGIRNACGNLVYLEYVHKGPRFDVRREISCH